MSEELKPCPRCGPKGKAISCCKTISGLIVYSVACVECGLKTLLYSTKAKAAENWNARPLEDELRARVEALEAALREIRDLARTGLPPDCIDEQYWRQHKLNQISGEADYALRKVEVKE